MKTLHTEIYNGYQINIYPDDDPINPRTDYDNLGTMACFHKRYSLGDTDHGLTLEQALAIEKDIHNHITVPIYMYDHGGIALQTTPFSCPWDSGKLGIIFVASEKVRKEWKVKRISCKLRDKIKSYLRNEVQEYNQFLCGNAYGYEVIDCLGEEIESVWGYSDEQCCIDDARSLVDHLNKKQFVA